ncbi:MAG: hypothetical protein ACLR30_02515 [[Clostridium] leptum]
MKCELIFYLAGRTGQLEELLEELLGGLGVIIAEVTAATSPEELAAALEKGVSRRNLLLVVGGLSRPDERNAARQAAAFVAASVQREPAGVPKRRFLTADHGPEGFFWKAGGSPLLLPDDPGLWKRF